MKDLFNGGQNPYYEAATPEEAAITKLALNERNIAFQEVDHEKFPSKYTRFYIDPSDHSEERIKNDIEILQMKIQRDKNAQIIIQYEKNVQHYSKYFNQNQKI